jgi:hypothetical protein
MASRKHKKTGDAGARRDRIVQAVGAAALVAASVDPWVVPMLQHPTIIVIQQQHIAPLFDGRNFVATWLPNAGAKGEGPGQRRPGPPPDPTAGPAVQAR